MKIAEVDPRQLADWSHTAQSMFPAPVEVHVLAQGYELRCGELQPLRLEPVDRS